MKLFLSTKFFQVLKLTNNEKVITLGNELRNPLLRIPIP